MTYAEWVQRKKQKCSVDDMVEYLKTFKIICEMGTMHNIKGLLFLKKML